MKKKKNYQNKRFTFSNKVKMLFIFKTEIVSLLAAAAESLQSCLTVRPHGQQPTRLLRSMGFSR